MKNLKYLLFGVLTAFVVTANVNAIANESDLMTCINGTEDVCKLTGDVTTSSEITLASNRVVTIDLGENTLNLGGRINVTDGASLTVKGNGEVVASTSTYMFNVTYGSTLILESGKYTNTTYQSIIVAVTGSSTDATDLAKTTVDIKSAAELSANYGIFIRNAGNNASYGVVVNYAGKYEGITGNNGYNDGAIGITINGNVKAKSGNVPVIIITGGSMKTVEGTTGKVNSDDAPVIYAAGYAIWNITGGVLEGSEALSIKAGEFNVTGGTLKAFGKYANPAAEYGNGSEATGAAISITASKGYEGAVKVNLKNADVASKNGNAIYEGISVNAEGKKSVSTSALANNGMKINGGTFNSAEGKETVAIEKEETGFITGGEFSGKVNEALLATNMESVQLPDGTYLVGEKHKVTVSEVTNGKITVDKAEAIAGETIKVTVTANEGYKVKSVTVNGKEVKDNKFTMPNEDAKVEVVFEELPKAPANVDTNPKTGDNVLLYGVLGLMAIVGLAYTFKQKRTN